MFNKSYFILPAVFDRETGKGVDLDENEDGSFSVPVGATTWDDVEDGYPAEIVCHRRASMSQGDFDAQFQNKVEILRGDYFTSEWFQHYTDEPTALVDSKGLLVWCGVDLAVSLQQKADEFAIASVGIQPKNFEIYILDYLSGRFTIQKQIDIIVDFFDIWDPVRTFIESNAYQAALQTLVQKDFPDVRAFPHYTTKDKITRALGLQVYYERKKMWHRKGRSAKLEKQLAGFPYVDHDDLFDAVDIAIMGALKGHRRRRREKEPKLW